MQSPILYRSLLSSWNSGNGQDSVSPQLHSINSLTYTPLLGPVQIEDENKSDTEEIEKENITHDVPKSLNENANDIESAKKINIDKIAVSEKEVKNNVQESPKVQARKDNSHDKLKPIKPSRESTTKTTLQSKQLKFVEQQSNGSSSSINTSTSSRSPGAVRQQSVAHNSSRSSSASLQSSTSSSRSPKVVQHQQGSSANKRGSSSSQQSSNSSRTPRTVKQQSGTLPVPDRGYQIQHSKSVPSIIGSSSRHKETIPSLVSKNRERRQKYVISSDSDSDSSPPSWISCFSSPRSKRFMCVLLNTFSKL